MALKPHQTAFIELALANQALKFGEFTLKSGRVSPYFFNMGSLFGGDMLTQMGQSYAQAIVDAGLKADVIFGPAYKGIPLACTTAMALATQHQHNVSYSFNRKEAKDHGEGGTIVGAPLAGDVIIVDDVITAGTAIRESMTLLENSEATLKGIVIALDRQERGQGALSAIQEIEQTYKIPVVALITLADIIEFASGHPDYETFLPAVEAYRAQYGQA